MQEPDEHSPEITKWKELPMRRSALLFAVVVVLGEEPVIMLDPVLYDPGQELTVFPPA